MDLETLTRAVDERFAAMAPVGWPEPRPIHESPRDEEYSRVTDPARYRIVQQRCRAWFDVLARDLGVGVADRALVEALERPASFGEYTRITRVRSPLPDTLDLWVLVREVPGDTGPLPVVEFSVAEPAAMFAALPQCGCDACDDGSAYLLGEVDAVMVSVVSGALEVDLQPVRSSVRMIDSASSGTGDVGRAPGAVSRFRGRPWFRPARPDPR